MRQSIELKISCCTYIKSSILLVLQLLTTQVGETCEYGSLPGVMSANANHNLTWRILDPDCPLEDKLASFLGYSPQAVDPNSTIQDEGNLIVHADADKNVQVLRVLIYGDSIDYHMGIVICAEAQQRHLKTELYEHDKRSPVCKIENRMKLVGQFMPGVRPQGPYPETYTEEDAVQYAVPKGFKKFFENTGDTNPDIVVFNALLWNLYGLSVRNQSVSNMAFLDEAYVREFMAELDNGLSLVENLVPAATMLVYHNAVYPKLRLPLSPGISDIESDKMGRLAHFMQFNAAARHVILKRNRWHMIDFAQLSEGTILLGDHLADQHHPNAPFYLQVLNILLNLYEDHKLKYGSPND